MSDYIHDAIEDEGLSLEAEPVDDQRYRCTLSGPRGSMVRDITMQPGYEEAPTLGQVLYHYMAKVQLVELTDDFLEWSDELGRDPADPNALAAYRQLVTDTDDLKRVLGMEAYDHLQTCLSMEQAISRARSSLESAKGAST